MQYNSSEELDTYKGLRVSDIITKTDISNPVLGRLQTAEKRFCNNEFGLPYFVAFTHHLGGKSLRAIAKDLGLYDHHDIGMMFSYFGIPHLSQKESIKRKWVDKNFREKFIKSTKAEDIKRWKNQDFRKRIAEASRTATYKKFYYREYIKNLNGAPYEKIILDLYDEFASNSNTYEELAKVISDRSGFNYHFIRVFLNKYLNL